MWDVACAALLEPLLRAGWWEAAAHLAWPDQFSAFAPFHVEAFAWWSAIPDGASPDPFAGCWFRDGGKSTHTAICVAFAVALGIRPYILWISDVLEQVIDKVTTVGTLLQSTRMRMAFPQAAEQWTDPSTGNKVDWRQGRIRTASGVTVDAGGMDQALRGRLVLLDRPGIVICDDIESGTDTKYMRNKKRKQLTEMIIPMGSDDVALVFIQNRIHKDSLMSQVIDGRADFFTSRVLSGPWPQVIGMETEVEELGDGRSQVVVTAGRFVWPEARGIDVTERQIRNMGLAAFRSEHQHEGAASKGHYFKAELWRRTSGGPVWSGEGVSGVGFWWDGGGGGLHGWGVVGCGTEWVGVGVGCGS